jgi:uncharacterized protein
VTYIAVCLPIQSNFAKLSLARKQNLLLLIEVQKVPALLDEVHWLIENKGTQFILSGSSPRKILRQGANLLGGRAGRIELYPLSYIEIPDFDLLKALNNGLLPRHYQSEDALGMISDYIGSYLEDEIVAETKIRNVETFSRFLEKAAFSNGEIVNYTNIASDCGISASSVREYFAILRDTLIGTFVESYQKKPKRRVVSAPKFYFFDVGVANVLLHRKNIVAKSIDYGHAFEHFIFHELRTYSQYSQKHYHISYWRTTSGYEVDFILGNSEVAIEVKASDNVNFAHTKGLVAFREEYDNTNCMVVSHDPYPRLMDNGVRILPWKMFLDKLWAGEII